jgi:hypothetical protein
VKCPFACLTLLLAFVPAQAQEPNAPIKLTLRPAAAPTPALKYLLLPELADLHPGNAALNYQRAHSFEWWRNIRRQPGYHEITDWLDLPLEQVAKKVDFVRRFGALTEVDRGARRESCDWQMTDAMRKEGIRMLVPDAQAFREYAVLLAMRCRLEIGEEDFARALYTLQTGFALGRHVGEAPILIHVLIGNSICALMLDRVQELIQAPGSPNLYWALTDLPRPLIDLRKGMQGEKLMLEVEFPDLKHIETELLSPEAQKRLLAKLNDPGSWELLREGMVEGRYRKLGFLGLALRAYPAAKRALIKRGRTEDEVDEMPVLQVILLEALHHYRRLRDEEYKWARVPYPQARAHWHKVSEELREVRKKNPAGALFLPFIPSMRAVQEGTVRLQRRIAALRCIEAIRLHAAAHGGKLPAKLSDITAVPVPADPATGKSFLYEVKGQRVTLSDPPLADGQPALQPQLSYELTFKN